MGMPQGAGAPQPWQGGPTQPGPGEPPRRPRAGLWIGLACVLVVLVLGFLAVTGGVVYLATRGGEDPAASPTTDAVELATFEHDYFTFDYPAGWFDLSDAETLEGTGAVVQLGDEDIAPDAFDEFAPQSIVVYVYDSQYQAVGACRSQAVWNGFAWDEAEDPEELEPVTLGGTAVPAHRTLGTHDGQDAVAEMYCADAGTNLVQIVVETHGASELSPEVRALLETWTWQGAAA